VSNLEHKYELCNSMKFIHSRVQLYYALCMQGWYVVQQSSKVSSLYKDFNHVKNVNCSIHLLLCITQYA
jgi:hypothetical protein